MAISKHSTKPQKSERSMTFKQIGRLPSGEFSDAFFAKLESESDPVLTMAALEKMEEFVTKSRTSRRAAILYLTRPWKDVATCVEKDRRLAVAFANLVACLDEDIKTYKALVSIMESARARMLSSLCLREDMDAVMLEGKRE